MERVSFSLIAFVLFSFLLGLSHRRLDPNPTCLDNLGIEHVILNQTHFRPHSMSWSAFSMSVDRPKNRFKKLSFIPTRQNSNLLIFDIYCYRLRRY